MAVAKTTVKSESVQVISGFIEVAAIFVMKFKLDGHHNQAFCSITSTMHSVSLRKLGARTAQRFIWSLMFAFGWGIAIPPALAAEQVTIRLGPFEQKIAIAELEQFAETGELPPHLQLYAPILNSQVREVLNRRLQIDPNLGDKVIDDLLRSPASKQLIDSLLVAIPGSSVEQIQAALTIAARQADGLNIISLLRAYPEENITLDATSAVTVALKFNPSYWQTQALSPLLARELAVNNYTEFNPSFNPSLPGSLTVQQKTLILQDRQRHRTIPVDIYWGEKAGEQRKVRCVFSPRCSTFSREGSRGNFSSHSALSTQHSPLASRLSPSGEPMVVISHGLGANRKFFVYLARHLASHGITVAALDHPDSNDSWLARVTSGNNPNELLPANEFIQRPKDISFLLDELAKLNRQPGLLQGKLNTKQVTVIGHSLGGYTALALAGAELKLSELRQSCKDANVVEQSPADWLQCAAANLPESKLKLRDQRVASAIAFNPVVGNLFGKTGLNRVEIPILILAGTEDVITPIINHQLRPFTQLHSPKYLLTAIGATHLSISEPPHLTNNATAGSLVKERRGEETQPLRQLIEGVSLAFVKQLTPEAKIYKPFLTPYYAQSLSTAAIPLRLNTELPASLFPWINTVLQVSQLTQQLVQPPKKASKAEEATADTSKRTWNLFLWAFLMPLPSVAAKTRLTRKK